MACQRFSKTQRRRAEQCNWQLLSEGGPAMALLVFRIGVIRVACFLFAALLATTRCPADLISGSGVVPATGVFQLDIETLGVVGSIPPGTAIPQAPGMLSLLSGGGGGSTTGFL